jgi:hypothetical protein
MSQLKCVHRFDLSALSTGLTVPSPAFGVVSQPEVEALNPLVGAMIR